ncbi:hypothetical protein GW7_10980 [Heterocephalus glaber]|uniref:Uncharacterized protein n=1 Tax=Heterocephalus glaber TaxID=10181 RepID=G5C4A4_HETGA|nr:hypothetical protein GW7_10980 [Heterocephalus glaber]
MMSQKELMEDRTSAASTPFQPQLEQAALPQCKQSPHRLSSTTKQQWDFIGNTTVQEHCEKSNQPTCPLSPSPSLLTELDSWLVVTCYIVNQATVRQTGG